ncbi:5-formyltetrahydrofolate cyclo-ligase [Bacillus massilinigeriensis]|uniref:5-formyltetrahydrofolate cyclo-ligase n=1 Tax=Bacillus mediterraneensis TaxID=1805474 RepID=UPI000ABB4557
MEKNQLRKKMGTMLKSLNREEYEAKSAMIAKNLFASNQWREAETVGITVSRFPEVDTYRIIEEAWESGKIVAVPKCIPSTKTMVFRRLDTFDALEKVYFGLWEPIVSETMEIASTEIDLMIVPGLAYTPEGFRLGFGGGYYDRYLDQFEGETVSLSFAIQVLPEVPLEHHDLKIGRIITERGMILRGE